MTVTSTTNQNSYTADGVTTVWSFTFRLIDPTQMRVYVNGVLQTNYTVQANANGVGGTITFTAAPLVGLAILIQSYVDLFQEDDLEFNEQLDPTVIENMVDKLTLQCQQLASTVNVAFGLPYGTLNFSGTLPAPVAGAIPAINATATGAQYIQPVQAGYALLDNGPGQPPSFQPVASASGGNMIGPSPATSSIGAVALYQGTDGRTLTSGAAPVQSGFVLTDNGVGAAPSFQALTPGILKIGGVTRGSLTTSLRPLMTVPKNMTVTPTGTAGSTQYTYSVVAVDAIGTTISAACTSVTTTTGNATLSGTNYNALSCTAVPGAASYRWYRTLGGGSSGKIATTTVPTLNDTGLAGDSSTAPTSTTLTGEFWHTGNFSTDAPIISNYARIYIDGNFTQSSTSHTITVNTELIGGGSVNAYSFGACGAGVGGGDGGPSIASSTSAAVVCLGGGGGGGNGGNGGAAGAYTSTTYGGAGGVACLIQNQLAGSAGGSGASAAAGYGGLGGNGGGAFLINSSGTITLAANITAQGGAGGAGGQTGAAGGGGGSGGTIALIANALVYSNTFNVFLQGGAGGSGYTGSQSGGGGGGGGGRFWGRIATTITGTVPSVNVGGGSGGIGYTGGSSGASGSTGLLDMQAGVGYALRSAA